MMLGVLLARAGVEVVVLEKHADFLRDFRGDTVHPSTRVLGNPNFRMPWPMKLFNRWPFLRRIPARVLGVGFRAEHVRVQNRER